MNTMQKQPLESIRVYPGRDARFTLFDDDGETNAYRTGAGMVTELRWNDAAHTLESSGKTRIDPALVKVMGTQ